VKKVSLIDSADRTGSRANISTNEIEQGPGRILDCKQHLATPVYYEDEIVIVFSFHSLHDIEDPVFDILLRNRYGLLIFGTTTYLMHQKTSRLKPTGGMKSPSGSRDPCCLMSIWLLLQSIIKEKPPIHLRNTCSGLMISLH
jgi:hypothetical protein